MIYFHAWVDASSQGNYWLYAKHPIFSADPLLIGPILVTQGFTAAATTGNYKPGSPQTPLRKSAEVMNRWPWGCSVTHLHFAPQQGLLFWATHESESTEWVGSALMNCRGLEHGAGEVPFSTTAPPAACQRITAPLSQSSGQCPKVFR